MSNHSKYPKEAGIYKLTCVNNGKIYIGKSINIYRRIGDHKRCSKRAKGRWYFENVLIKHGWDSFTVEILEIFKNFDKLKDNDTLLEMESRYLKLFDSTNRSIGYNICKFSNDTTGKIISPEHIEKLRMSNLGKTRSEETKEKIRQSTLGRIVSDETKAKMRQSHLGKPHSEEVKEKMRKPKSDEHKENMRKGQLGKVLSGETKDKIRNAKLGKPRSEETIEKIKQSLLGNTNTLGYIHSEESKEKMRLAKLGKKKNI